MQNEDRLRLILEECQEQLDELGIQYGDVSEITVNKRAKKRWGQCCKQGDSYNINISSMLMDERVSDESLRTTVMHELLHTCSGAMNHGKTWKRLAERVNDKYGYNVKRCTNVEEKGMSEYINEINKPKHIFVCESCGQEVRRFRESKFTKNYEYYRCGRCKGRLKKLY